MTPHLLVVDDHAAFRKLAVLRLRALGCTCVAVESVPDAIDALARERFDAVVSDHSLPGPSGLDLLAYMHHGNPPLGAVAVYDKSDLVDAFRLAA